MSNEKDHNQNNDTKIIQFFDRYTEPELADLLSSPDFIRRAKAIEAEFEYKQYKCERVPRAETEKKKNRVLALLEAIKNASEVDFDIEISSKYEEKHNSFCIDVEALSLMLTPQTTNCLAEVLRIVDGAFISQNFAETKVLFQLEIKNFFQLIPKQPRPLEP